METPLQLEFHGVDASDDMRDLVEHDLAKLEKRYGRTTACRVVIHGPDGNHKSGAPFGVSVRIALPGKREVHVDHTHTDDGRLSDAGFAIHDAFKRALKQLSTEAQLLRNRSKRVSQRVLMA